MPEIKILMPCLKKKSSLRWRRNAWKRPRRL